MSAAVKKSRIHHATVHTLWHSFTTHLVQAGTDIKQQLESNTENRWKWNDWDGFDLAWQQMQPSYSLSIPFSV